ncbi:hypothetical protein POM88_003527 [Heracleum sosnowskyi]|uniref:F-box domain-containing protein n=1 Tax=Heracleum sosnowskyi TaxID=360622 RepID=A0AAD8NCD6_9APIA|nr:hypothetical protein POM88_003527 [Heracleum sosnowskyi]
MEERRWEDMNPDYLANIFWRLDPESRIQAVQLVCKQWHQAVRNPLCWKRLIFYPWIFSARSKTEFIKFAASLSQRRATVLVLPHVFDREDLVYFSEECPALKLLTEEFGINKVWGSSPESRSITVVLRW